MKHGEKSLPIEDFEQRIIPQLCPYTPFLVYLIAMSF
jgi:hypothetical protein